MSEHLLERRENGVAWLTLNRPERLNALTDGMLDGLLAAMQRLSEPDSKLAQVLQALARRRV
ncbi:MAG: hypothetical protein OXH14_18680, partial [Alphaproteobacteria bacterium]|nr:hypothetical protein [Alphaproteobacteria bacterium]